MKMLGSFAGVMIATLVSAGVQAQDLKSNHVTMRAPVKQVDEILLRTISMNGKPRGGMPQKHMSMMAGASDRSEDYHQDFIYGAPADPSEAWTIMSGGRLYDNWYKSLDKEKPEATHVSWPTANTKKKGAVTWRCKSCHGWDFSGKDGAYAKGSYKTGIVGVRQFSGKKPNEIIRIIRDTAHKYTTDMISDDAALRIGTFLSKGQYETTKFIAADKSVSGDTKKGKEIFQTTCAACHGFNGKALNWGTDEKPKFVGSEANGNPWETVFKIRHGHPGVEMIGLVAFPMSDSINLLAYLKTLPQK